MKTKKENEQKRANKQKTEIHHPEKTKKDENSSEKAQKVEVKKIEGKEPEKLEYFSKDDLIEKITSLENELKSKKQDLKKVDEELKKAKEEKESWKNKYTRLQAEFENAEKRWIKTRQNLRIEYTASVLKSFLPLYDSFKKALENEDENNRILKGFFDQFMNILKSYKAEPLNVKKGDVFDYEFHDALSSIEKEDTPENTILEVIQDGWKLDKEVLRYTKVIISKKPKPPEPIEEPEKEEQEENSNEEKNELDNTEEKN